MDISRKYIEMCEGTKKIQKQRKREWKWSDIYCVLPIERIRMDKIPSICQAPSLILGEVDFKRYKQEIWLPRQDQLQEMRFCGKAHPDAMIYLYNRWREHNSDYLLTFKTMEQVLLAELMYGKFNEVWDGKEWIKKNG